MAQDRWTRLPSGGYARRLTADDRRVAREAGDGFARMIDRMEADRARCGANGHAEEQQARAEASQTSGDRRGAT